jgi:hypothetical protein
MPFDLQAVVEDMDSHVAKRQAEGASKEGLTGAVIGSMLRSIARQFDALEARLLATEKCLPEYHGVYRVEGPPYAKNAVVTHNGGMWIARTRTKTKPGTDATWTLCVKGGDRR